MQKRMPQQLKIFLIKLVVLLVIAAIVATMIVISTRVTGQTSTYAFPDVSGLPAFEFGDKVFNRLSEVDDNGEEIYKEYKLVEENDNYELYFSDSDLDIALVHKASGEVWFSNPSEQTIQASTGMSARMRSQLIIRTVDKTSESISTKNSYTDSLAYQKDRDENNLDAGKDVLKQYYITTNPEGGLRVVYIIGQVPLPYNFPVLIPEARYSELLATIEANGGLTARMLTEANYKLVNSTIWADTTSTTITNDQKDNIKSNAPNIEDLLAEGGSYYVLHSVSIWQNRLLLSNMESYFAESGITAEEIDEYNDSAGFVSDNSNLFLVPMDYYLEADGLKVSVPSEEIEYDDSRYDITSITLMEYFGSADSTEEGYIVVPDGSGALINFNNGKVQFSSEMSIPLYGEDRGKGNSYDKAPAITEQGYLPVWGIKKETSSLFCIIEGAEAVATVKADVNRGSRSPSNKAWAEFQYVGSDDVSFLGLDQTLTAYQEEPIKEKIEVKYSILPASEGNEYSDMARYYREYLIARDDLREQTAKENIPFNVELEGAIDSYETAFGVGYWYVNPLTSYSQAQEILSLLTDGGVENISVRYRGWANQGLYNRYWNRIRLLSEMGSRDELNQLISYAADNNIDIFYDVELITVGTANLLDGFFTYTDVSREISRSNAFYKQFDLMNSSNWNGSYIVKPSKVSSAAQTLIEDFKDMGLNSICLGRMGEVLTGDYNTNELNDRNEVQDIYADVNKHFEDAGFKIANVSANSYMLGGTSVLFELPNTSSTHYMADESIPFYQMVVHGLISYSGEAINQSGDPQRSLLNAVEYGAGLFYRWMYADDVEMYDNDVEMYDNYYEDMYALNYVSWLDNAIESYTRYNEELGHTAQLRMTNHRRISEDLSLTEYEDGTQVYVNYSNTETTVDGVTVPANDYLVVRKGA